MLSGARVTTLNSSGARLAMPRVSFALLPQAATTKAAPTRIGTEIRRPDTSITSRFDGLCGNLALGKQGFHEQQYHADTDRGIRQIEGGPEPASRVDVEENENRAEGKPESGRRTWGERGCQDAEIKEVAV